MAQLLGGRATSINPAAERSSSLQPVHRMLAATRRASRGSSQSQPVAQTNPTPTMTPTEVHTSVRRWWASASRVIER